MARAARCSKANYTTVPRKRLDLREANGSVTAMILWLNSVFLRAGLGAPTRAARWKFFPASIPFAELHCKEFPGPASSVIGKGFSLILGMLLTFSTANAASTEPLLDAADLPEIAPTEPDTALKTFRVRPGFHLEVAAAEPLVADPVAMSFDENGRLFIAEMIGYSERQNERLGRIRLLEDTDEDGRFDKSTVYADQLPWPTGIICYGGGVFVGATPDIFYFKDNDADGVADAREVVFTGFGEGVDRLNVQRLLNSFRWGLDNRIHGASGGSGGRIVSPKTPGSPPLNLGGRDFSFDPKTFDIRTEQGGGQNGMSFDDAGRKFVCSNSAHIQLIVYDDRLAAQSSLHAMPPPLVNIPEDGPSAEVFRISPDEPWRVIRTQWRVAGLVPGPVEGGGRPSGYFTAATGVTIYRGNAWPRDYVGDAFIADCGSNLIHRKKLHADGVSLVARRAGDEQKTEFAASSDNWFRPVQFANAPDGTLYVADMYRQTIEHPWSLPESMKKHLDLNRGNDRGRIYRIVPDGFKQPKLPRLKSATTRELVKVLDHANGWHRDTAARLIYERQDRSAAGMLEEMIGASGSALGRLHALCALDGLNAFTDSHVEIGLSDSDPRVRARSVRFAARSVATGEAFSSKFGGNLPALANDPDPEVRFQLALALGSARGPARVAALAAIIRRDAADPWIRAAVLNGIGAEAGLLFSEFSRVAVNPHLLVEQVWDSAEGQEFLAQLARMVGMQDHSSKLRETVKSIRTMESRTAQFNFAAALLDGLKRGRNAGDSIAPEIADDLKVIVGAATAAATERSFPDSMRIAAARLIGRTEWETSRRVLPALLDANQPQLLQAAVVQVLVRYSEPQASRELVEKWPLLTPRLRAGVLASLLSRSERISILFSAIQADVVTSSELSATQIQFLNTHRDGEIRRQAGALFETKRPADRSEVVESFSASLNLAGSSERGRVIYEERCASCHRQGKEGFAVGPDFSSVKANGKEKLLISILDPNREVPPNYLNYTIETKDGESLMGLIAAENDGSVTLRRAFGDESVVTRESIQRIQTSKQSVMPEGLEASLTPLQMSDLLEFIVSGAGLQ